MQINKNIEQTSLKDQFLTIFRVSTVFNKKKFSYRKIFEETKNVPCHMKHLQEENTLFSSL